MTENSLKDNPETKLILKVDNDEVNAIGISLGLTALAAAVIYSNEISFIIRLICLTIFILGGLSVGFLYFTFLINKIPETMGTWLSKGAFSRKGMWWIVSYYSKMLLKQLFSNQGITLEKIRELGFLTILAMLSILWFSFLFITIEITFGIDIINLLQQLSKILVDFFLN